MNNLTLGRYVPYNSIVHRLDPRFKFFAMILMMVGIFIKFTNVSMNFIMYGVIIVIIITLMILSKVSFVSFIKSLRSLWFMVIFLLIINLLLPSSGAYFVIFKSVKIHYDALYQTAYIFLRLVMMLSLTTILTTTTRPLDLTYALEWYLYPFKIVKLPSEIIAMVLSLALRFIPTLLDEANRIMKAQASRGVDFVNGKFREKLKAIISLIIPLFISAFQRSEELANAMEARGYDPSRKRTRYRLLRWKWRDTSALVIALCVFSGIIYVSVAKVDFVVLINQIAKVGG